MPNDYLNTINRIEKDITAIDLTAAAASISISPRRIADVMEKKHNMRAPIEDVEIAGSRVYMKMFGVEWELYTDKNPELAAAIAAMVLAYKAAQ